MPAPQLFKVLTEFRFEIGSAVASSDKLSGAVDKISQSADNALFSFQKLGLGIVSNLSGASGGILGVLGTASKVSTLFDKTAIQFSSILGVKAGNFGQRMAFAEKKIKKIQKLSSEFGISSNDLAALTKFIAPAVKPKLGANEAFDKSINLSRAFLKSAPTLGLNTQDHGGQLQDAILGRASMSQKLFTVLSADTKAMAAYNGESKKFNKLPLAERMEKLTQAFGQFANDKSAIDAITNTVTGQLDILREVFIGLNSVLLPLGRVVNKVLVDGLKNLNSFVESTIRPIMKDLAFGLDGFVQGENKMEGMFATFMQLKNLSKDVSDTSSLSFLTGGILGLHHGLKFLKIEIPGVTKGLDMFAKTTEFFAKDLIANTRLIKGATALTGGFGKGLITKFGSFGTAIVWVSGFLSKAVSLVTRIFGPMLLVLGIFQLMSRTAAHVKIVFAKNLASIATVIRKTGAMIMRVGAVFMKGFDNIAQMLATSFIMDAAFAIFEGILDGIFWFTQGLGTLMAVFQGIFLGVLETFRAGFAAYAEYFKQISSFFNGDGFSISKITNHLKSIPEAYKFGVQEMMEDIFGNIENDGSSISNKNTYVENINVKNDFKENFEADRIAFSLTNHLQKLAQNPTGARNSTFKPLGAGGN